MQKNRHVRDEDIHQALSILEGYDSVERAIILDLGKIWGAYSSSFRNEQENSGSIRQGPRLQDQATNKRNIEKIDKISKLPVPKKPKNQHFTQDEVTNIFHSRPNIHQMYTGECFRRICAAHSKKVNSSHGYSHQELK